MSVQPGTLLGPYEILAPLGTGGFGQVFRARDTRLGREVALKVLPAHFTTDDSAIERFVREARAASALNHPNIVTVHDVGESREMRFIVMELIDGCTLRELLRTEVPFERGIELGSQIARALNVAHLAGIVHGDIKPENVMVRRDGYVKVVDFGLARLWSPPQPDDLTVAAPSWTAGLLLGTPRYMAPEQANGQPATAMSDIFALGLVLCELTTGLHPFGEGAPLQILQAIASQTALLPRTRVDVEALLEKMLDRTPSSRPTAAEVEAALTGIVRAEPPAPRTRAAPPRPVVGRAREREELRAAFSRTTVGQGLVVGIAGEPGIGKTTLVDEFLRDTADAATPTWIARGGCSERLAGTEAYLPILEALESLVRGDSTGLVSRTLRRLAPTWASQVLPDAAQQPPAALTFGPHAPTQDRLKRELGNLIEELCRTRPLILIVEDLHWSGASTIALLAYLGTRLGSLRALVLVTYRPEELRYTRHPFLPVKLELQMRGVCREIQLAFLTEHELAGYLDVLFPGHEFPPEFASLLHAKTEGSPLFLVDLVRRLQDRGDIAHSGGQWRLTRALPDVAREVPESVRSLIERKIGLLSDADRQLLRVASVQGDRFEAATVAAALGLDTAEVEERLEELERHMAFVCRLGEQELPDGTITLGYRFVHVLYQNALYGSLTPARRASLSAAVAEALERRYTSRPAEVAAELAVLFETAREPERAAHYFCLAAEHAGRISAHREAVSLGQHGLELLAAKPHDRMRQSQELKLLAAVAPSLVATKGYGASEVRDTYGRARELSQQLDASVQRFAALRGLWEYHWLRTDVSTALELAHELFGLAERLGDTALRVVAHGVMGDTSLHLGDFPRARDYTDGGIGLYDPGRHHSLAADYVGYDPGMACGSMGSHAHWYLGFPDQALQRSHQAVALARQLGHPSTLAFALAHAGLHHYLRQEPRLTLDRAEEATAVSTEYGLAFWSAFAAILKGWSLVQLERNPNGIEQIEQGLVDYGQTGGYIERPYWLAMLAEAHQSTGSTAEGLAILEQALQEIHDTGCCFFEAELQRLKGELSVAEDASHAAMAERSFRDALDIAGRQQAKSLELRAAVSLGRLLERQGEREQAHRALTDVFSWFSEGSSSPDLMAARALLEHLS